MPVAGSAPLTGTHTDSSSIILQLHYMEYVTYLVATEGDEVLENYAWVLYFSSQLTQQYLPCGAT